MILFSIVSSLNFVWKAFSFYSAILAEVYLERIRVNFWFLLSLQLQVIRDSLHKFYAQLCIDQTLKCIQNCVSPRRKVETSFILEGSKSCIIEIDMSQPFKMKLTWGLNFEFFWYPPSFLDQFQFRWMQIRLPI